MAGYLSTTWSATSWLRVTMRSATGMIRSNASANPRSIPGTTHSGWVIGKKS